jgi:hypothetical protein
MSFLPASSTKRRLFKIASLGIAGLLAGLLAGCNDSLNTSASTAKTPYTSSDPLAIDANSDGQTNQLPRSLDETQIPALRHPPTSRSLQYGSVRTVSMPMAESGRNRS